MLVPAKNIFSIQKKDFTPNMLMTADFAFSSYPPKNIFSLIAGKLIFGFLWFSLVIII